MESDEKPRFQVGQRVQYRLGSKKRPKCTGQITEGHITATGARMYVVTSDAGMTHALHEHELTAP
jgi:hypothetical protein